MTDSLVTADLTWRVGSGLWDLNTTANWTQFGAAVKYTEPNSVLFDDTASGPFPITVTNNFMAAPTGIKVIGTNHYTIFGSGAIAGEYSRIALASVRALHFRSGLAEIRN